MKKFLAKVWRGLSGKKTWIGIGGLAVDAAVTLSDNPMLVELLPQNVREAVRGGLVVLTAAGVLHKADKREIKRTK